MSSILLLLFPSLLFIFLVRWKDLCTVYYAFNYYRNKFVIVTVKQKRDADDDERFVLAACIIHFSTH